MIITSAYPIYTGLIRRVVLLVVLTSWTARSFLSISWLS